MMIMFGYKFVVEVNMVGDMWNCEIALCDIEEFS